MNAELPTDILPTAEVAPLVLGKIEGFAQPQQLTPGYELRDEIARGGMGVVYRAVDLAMNRDVAVKVLQDKYSVNSQAARRFLEEAQITGQLQHPGIPPVYVVGKFPDGRPYLAMKLIKGQTLDELVKSNAVTNPLAVFEAIAQAIGYAHAHNVIHRDLKPANIMVGAFGEVQVMDWGLAKVLSPAGNSISEDRVHKPSDTVALSAIKPVRDTNSGSMTEYGSIVGTLAYMPPEQAGGELDKITRASDVFGLGSILCTLLTGKPPYTGTTMESIRTQALRGLTQEAFARLDACEGDSEVIALCKECLSFEPSVRPADGNVVAVRIAELRRVADERARQAELAQAKAEVQTGEQRKRRRVLAWSAATVMTILFIGFATSAWLGVRAMQAKAETANQLVLTNAAKIRADERTKQARDAFNQMVFSIQDKLKNRPDTQDVRKELLEKARKGLTEILEQDREQGSTDTTMVWSRFRLGDLERQLGNTLKAKQEYEAGHALAVQAVEANPTSTDAAHDLALGHERLGNISLALGQREQALEYYQKYLKEIERILTTDPNHTNAQLLLGVCYNKLGIVSRQLRETKQALGFHQKSQTHLETLLRANPNNEKIQRELILTYSRLGEVNEQLQLRKTAKAFYQKSLAIREQLANPDTNNADDQRELAVIYSQLADMSLRTHEINQARDYQEKALAIWEELAKSDPKNVPTQSELSASYTKLSTVLRKAEQFPAAIEYMQKSLAICERLAKADPGNIDWQTGPMMAYSNLADIAIASLDFKTGIKWLTKVNDELIEFQKTSWYTSPRQLIGNWSYTKWKIDVNRRMNLCRDAENAIEDIEYIFCDPNRPTAIFLYIRIRGLLKAKKYEDAQSTAERMAQWVETVKDNRDVELYNVASAFALCAAAIDNRRDVLTERTVLLLQQAKKCGYFTLENLAEFQNDRDYVGLHSHPKFIAFLAEFDR